MRHSRLSVVFPYGRSEGSCQRSNRPAQACGQPVDVPPPPSSLLSHHRTTMVPPSYRPPQSRYAHAPCLHRVSTHPYALHTTALSLIRASPSPRSPALLPSSPCRSFATKPNLLPGPMTVSFHFPPVGRWRRALPSAYDDIATSTGRPPQPTLDPLHYDPPQQRTALPLHHQAPSSPTSKSQRRRNSASLLALIKECEGGTLLHLSHLHFHPL